MNMYSVLTLALTEAQDINLHLKPLRSHIEDVEQSEFDEVKKHLSPMMHVICLIWSHSKYYNTPARIIVLLQEICNLLIHLVCSLTFSIGSNLYDIKCEHLSNS